MFFHSKVTEDQIVDLMKAFAQADKVSFLWFYGHPFQYRNLRLFFLFFSGKDLLIASFHSRLTSNYKKIHNQMVVQDGDGILTAEEYKTTFHEHGIFVGQKYFYLSLTDVSSPDEDWVRTMMEKIDLDGDGNISLQEFVEMNMK